MTLLQSGSTLYFNPSSGFLAWGYMFAVDESNMPDIVRNARKAFVRLALIDAVIGICWAIAIVSGGNATDYPPHYPVRIAVVCCAWLLALATLFQAVNYKTTRIAREHMPADTCSCRQPLAMQLPFWGFLSVFVLSFPLISFGVPLLRPASLTLTGFAAAVFVAATLDYLRSFKPRR
jgi:hypothetical protein